MEVTLAGFEHLEEVTELFDLYRVFYKQTSNLEASRNFLQQRLQAKDSTIFIARENDCGIGFIQLYPSFSSALMQRIWILNDLFVKQSHRQQGVAKLLMGTAEKYARETAAVRIILATQISNHAAQALYESLGYIKDREFYRYTLQL